MRRARPASSGAAAAHRSDLPNATPPPAARRADATRDGGRRGARPHPGRRDRASRRGCRSARPAAARRTGRGSSTAVGSATSATTPTGCTGPQLHRDAVTGRQRADHVEAERPGEREADDRRVGEQLVRLGDAVGRHADALVGHREHEAVSADGARHDDRGVRRRERGRVLEQLGEEVGEVGRPPTRDREVVVDARRARRGGSRRSRPRRRARRRRARSAAATGGAARRRRARAGSRRCVASGWPCGRA